MADPKTPADLKQWTELATKERKGKDPADLVWHIPVANGVQGWKVRL